MNFIRLLPNAKARKAWVLLAAWFWDLTGSLTPRGIIALQIHGVGKDTQKVGLKVSCRNLRLRELTNQ